MCLAEFVANYQVKYNSSGDDDDDDDNDMMPPLDDVDVSSLKEIKLTDDFGIMRKRRQ